MINPIDYDSDIMAMVEDLWRKQREIIDYLNEKAIPVVETLAAKAARTGNKEDLEKYLEERRK